MRSPVTRKAAVATGAVALAMGFSSLVVLATPAQADAVTCVQGTYVSSNICELQILSGTGTFTPDSSMGKLQALLVGGGGSSSYGYGGGGGSVIVYNYADTSKDIAYSVGDSGQASATIQDSTQITAAAGTDGDSSNAKGGDSGTWVGYQWVGEASVAGGAGAWGNGGQYDGGAGIDPGYLSTSASPFTFDSTTYGGGGAGADFLSGGVASAGGGYVLYISGSQSSVDARPNSGGGGGGGDQLESNSGAGGIIVFRWEQLAPVTYTGSFNLGGHGTAIDPQVVNSGDLVTKPSDPTADGFTFGGWFTDEAVQVAAAFDSPVTADTTFFAKWTAVPTFTGSFNLGGHGTAIDQQVVDSGDLFVKPADPTADGFTFGGWFTDAELLVAADFTSPVTADTTLFAAWTAVVPPTDTAPTTDTQPTTDTGPATLASTGADISPLIMPLGIVVLVLGGGLIFWSARRARLRRK